MSAGISTRNRATMEKSSLLLKLKACAGQRVTLFECLDWKTPCLMHTLANQLRSPHKDTWAFYASVDGLSLGTTKSRRYRFLKSAWRDHPYVLYKLSQNRHAVTVYCSLVGLNKSTLQEKTTEFSMLHRRLIFSLFIGTNRHVLLLLMICIYV